MKNLLLLVLSVLCLTQNAWTQNSDQLNLDNVLIVGQQDDVSDRYILEVGLLELFNQYNIKSKASLNVVKQRGDNDILLKDSVYETLKHQGIDTYLLVSVRGYNKRFKRSDEISSLADEISAGHLYPLYRKSAARVTFSFTFYRDRKPVYHELIRTGTVGSKDKVMKKLLKKVERKLSNDWL